MEYEYYEEEEEEEPIVEKKPKTTTTAKPLLYKTITRSRPTTTSTTTTTTTTVRAPTISAEEELEKVVLEEEEDPKVIKELIELIKKAGLCRVTYKSILNIICPARFLMTLFLLKVGSKNLRNTFSTSEQTTPIRETVQLLLI